MTWAALALVIGAACLHATWNALAKRGSDAFTFLWLATVVASLALLAPGAWVLATDGLPPAALPFVAATIVLHAAYFFALGRSYGAGDLSLVYPIARGLGVALVPILAVPLFAERLSGLGTAGVALVVVGIVVLHVRPHAWRAVAGAAGGFPGGTGWAILTGLTIAAYSLVDKAGVARLHPVPYLGLMFAGTTLLLLPAMLADPARLGREWRRNRATVIVAGLLTLSAYLLVLFAFRLTKVGYVVAARELSIVFSTLLGLLWLREGHVASRLAGAAIILAGVICIALA